MWVRWILGAVLASAVCTAMADGSPWVLIDTHTGTLAVMRDGHVVERFAGIAIGRGGAAPARVRGDDRTPLGVFRIAWVNDHSPYRRFYGLDYPNRRYATQARDDGLIDEHTYREVTAALQDGQIPPQDTALGGNLGIHGLGDASLRIHRLFNWTQGCVALTNRQIDRLARWIAVGTKVVIE